MSEQLPAAMEETVFRFTRLAERAIGKRRRRRRRLLIASAVMVVAAPIVAVLAWGWDSSRPVPPAPVEVAETDDGWRVTVLDRSRPEDVVRVLRERGLRVERRSGPAEKAGLVSAETAGAEGAARVAEVASADWLIVWTDGGAGIAEIPDLCQLAGMSVAQAREILAGSQISVRDVLTGEDLDRAEGLKVVLARELPGEVRLWVGDAEPAGC